MSTTDPTTAAPATPGQDDMRHERAILRWAAVLRWAADRLEAEPTTYDGADERAESVEKLRRWADELSTTPPTDWYAMHDHGDGARHSHHVNHPHSGDVGNPRANDHSGVPVTTQAEATTPPAGTEGERDG